MNIHRIDPNISFELVGTFGHRVEESARRKMASGDMVEETRHQSGDYIYESQSIDEPETHWDKAVIVEEMPA